MDSAHRILSHIPFNPSLASVITASVVFSLGIVYVLIFGGQRVATNATRYALTEDALKNPAKAREQWFMDAREILQGGVKKVKGAISVISPNGPMIFLPNSYAHEIRNRKEFGFGPSIAVDMFAHYKGLSPYKLLDYHDITQEVVRINLTRSLDSITDEMNAEVEEALTEVLGNIPDWKSIELKHVIYRLIARLSTRIFLGRDFSRNQEWLEIAVSYTANSSGAARKLLQTHPLLRPFAQYWIPEVKNCRQQVARARELINPLVQDRLQRKANGESSQKTADMLSWVSDNAEAKGVKIDFAEVQLLLAFVALHTTTETMSWLMCDLLENKEWIPRLREEIVSSLIKDGGGWKKTTLASMELLDSAMKESQRLNPINEIPMQRIVMDNVTLGDGTIIPKGYRASVQDRFQDPTLYPDANKFKADRFLELRATNRNKWHFVSGSPEHLGFGYGNHTCPGRFFASNEIKVVMAHFLMKYDWALTKEGRLPTCNVGSEHFFDGRQKVLVRSRVPEIDMSSL